ncbi:cupin domain-containing protein [Yoonia sp. BS5-3]|uniref:Cupin domain-containing protein n=1 Tax=Yoonia phaeophyticola TaxID=3137369 RepID=A0ABZ2V9E6_9RHOB
MYLSLMRAAPRTAPPLAVIAWKPHADTPEAHPAGQVVAPDDADADAFFATLTDAKQTGPHVLMSHACPPVSGPVMLRLDEVCFPVGAVAARHTHAGAGIRYLVRGALKIEAEDHTQVMTPGACWFEPENAPVRATALHGQGVTSFLRAMIIPAAYAGKSTFQLVDPADAALPRLQQTHRHMDLPL